MTKQELIEVKQKYIETELSYQMRHYKGYSYSKLGKAILTLRKNGRSKDVSYYNDVIIMADTETSKQTVNALDPEGKHVPVPNYVVAWTISIRAFHRNIVTLWGRTPKELMHCITLIHDNLRGDKTVIYYHNRSYDYCFLSKYERKAWGTPVKQLNIKPHFPLTMEYENGLVFKDSLMLAQRSLEKWAEDMNVEHRKSVGKWDYSKIRNQKEDFTPDELEYIEHDTLAGVECIDALMATLKKNIVTIPLTATGIPREESRKIGLDYNANSVFKENVPPFHVQQLLEKIYHGGFTHANRHIVDNVLYSKLIGGNIKCKDFASSYPAVMLTQKYPISNWATMEDTSIEKIMSLKDDYAFIFKVYLIRPMLKDTGFPMPTLQKSKCDNIINGVYDNGRILGADYIELTTNEIDWEVYQEQYSFDFIMVKNIYYAAKGYLPRWFTNYVFDLYRDKCTLKDGDPVLYAIAKAKLNSLYGMCVMKPIRAVIEEIYGTEEFRTQELTTEHAKIEYEKFTEKKNQVLQFSWGVWVTSYAFRNLMALGKCIDYDNGGFWAYSDTDSIYAYNWDEAKLEAYNNNCKELLKVNGYGAVEYNGKEYWLGVAADDGEYSEFITQGCKRYACRDAVTGKLKITVAGVPKKTGAICLKDDIENFKRGLVFDGETTGKKLHTYLFVDEIYTDSNGNEIADSIDLTPCDYLLDGINDIPDWETLISEEVTIDNIFVTDNENIDLI